MSKFSKKAYSSKSSMAGFDWYMAVKGAISPWLPYKASELYQPELIATRFAKWIWQAKRSLQWFCQGKEFMAHALGKLLILRHNEPASRCWEEDSAQFEHIVSFYNEF